MVASLPDRVSKPLFSLSSTHGPQRKPTSSRLCTEQGCDPLPRVGRVSVRPREEEAWTLVPTEGLLYREPSSRPEPTSRLQGCWREGPDVPCSGAPASMLHWKSPSCWVLDGQELIRWAPQSVTYGPQARATQVRRASSTQHLGA